ncbi:MAG TPA: ATP-binding protein [Terriglobia bacterium]|nr:ATP-binding protein [Terriglobia bacterium]
MLRRLPFRIEASFGIAFGLVVLVGSLEYRITRRLLASNRSVEHAEAVLTQVEGIRGALGDVGSSARLYVITGTDGELEAYHTASRDLSRDVDATGRLTADNPIQRDNVLRLRALVAARLAASDNLVAARRLRGTDAAGKLLLDGSGVTLSRSVLHLTDQVQGEEHRLFDVRERAVESEVRTATWTLVFGLLLAVGLVTMAGIESHRANVVRERAAVELRRAEELLRSMVGSVRDYAIFMLDPTGRVQTWNAGAEAIKGYATDEIVGQHFSRFYTPEDVAEGRPEKQLAQVAETGRVEDEGWRVRKDGSRFWANAVITAVRDESGKLMGFSKVTRDITALKRAEETIQRANAELEVRVAERTAELAQANRLLESELAERQRAQEEIRQLNATLERRVAERTSQLEAANRELEAFTYSVAHDLRAPLRHINGFSQILTEELGGELGAAAQEYLGRIRHATASMSRLIDDLLEVARLGRQAMSWQQVDLQELVREVVEELEPEVSGRPIEWRVGKLPPARCDRVLMKQAVANLISNAVKYTRPRNPALIEVDYQENADGRTVFYVRDNGVGFSMEHAHKLFGVFQRLHASEDFEGTGVGLAVVQRVFQRHGGRVWAQAQAGKGATFYFTLDLAGAAGEAAPN